MSYIFEIYYGSPEDLKRESDLTIAVGQLGGRLTYREVPANHGEGPCVLTYEFDDLSKANHAADAIRQRGEHVEGPVDYGPDVPEVHVASTKKSKPGAKNRRAAKEAAAKQTQRVR